ncbi:hypothetical protein [Variovorax ginsengisoli]|uniref:Uncharacterized protein n=1 Tax=Variovorax ginsengisoli TaxID=363844 RepID=A0ABT8SFT8_9BURK|nr:hypothetical protein [Variovorax ginsengisoli]MDN8618058.1 hypothetical protein [Variovorax ginsengisoli]MDO1537228.1 hypothetical protein [Variovorax ginsengisoli]
MKITQILEIERALQSIEVMLAGCHGDDESAPGFGLTRLSEPRPPGKKIAAGSVKEEKFASQECAAIHLCLTCAATLLAVVQRLMTEPAIRSPKERAERLCKLVSDIRAGGRTAFRAGLVLVGQDTSLAGPIDRSQDQEQAARETA